MTYAVKEIFLTLQGEGVRSGRRAVFLRFAGCNLWSGREQDRHDATCTFCDTDFVGTDGDGGGKFANADALVEAVVEAWRGVEDDLADGGTPYVVLTGGEPMLQVDDALVEGLHDAGFEIAIETNGTLPVHPGIDWVCVSPKAGSTIVQTTGDELKLVWPQPGSDYRVMQTWDFANFLIQPLDDLNHVANSEAAINFVLRHPAWRLSLQTHKMLGLR